MLQTFLPCKHWAAEAVICIWKSKIVASSLFQITGGLRKYTGWILHVFVSLSNLFYSQLQNNYLKEFLQPRVLFTTDDFHLFTCCEGFSRGVLIKHFHMVHSGLSCKSMQPDYYGWGAKYNDYKLFKPVRRKHQRGIWKKIKIFLEFPRHLDFHFC